jgi:uncharacterized protein YukE
MTDIRVDPTELAKAAKELADLSERIRKIGDEAHAAGASAPSYDGEFGPRVERLGLEALSALDSQSQRVGLHASELRDIAQAFSDADHQAVQGFEQLAIQSGGILEWLRQAVFGGIMGEYPPLSTWQQPEPPPGQPPEDDQTWLERLADQVGQPEFFWDLFTGTNVAEWMTKVKNSPPITIVLPMLKGFGMDDVSGPLVRTVDSSFWIRTAGRVIGDASAPPLFFIGWGLSVGPEVYRNIQSNAPWNEFAADLVVDTGIYTGSEVAGWGGFVGGNALGGPAVGVPSKLAADAMAGAGLEFFVDKNGLRESLASAIEPIPAGISLWFSTAIGDGVGVEIPPVPTPPGLYSATETPVPPSMLDTGLGSTPDLATPIPFPSPDPSPVQTPPPDSIDG